MDYKKITAEDIAGKGVVGQADTPLLSALEMQNKVEEVPRAVIIPHFNSLIDSLDQRDTAVDTALSDRYTKTETDKAIGDKLTEIGAGDMQKAVYDTDGDGVVDNAAKLAGKTPGQLTFGADQIITDENSDERLPETLATFASCEELNDSTRTAEELVKAYVTNMPRNTMRYVTTYSSDRNAMWLCGTYKYDGCGFALKMNYDGDYRMEMYAQDNGVWADTAIVPGMDLLWENASPGSQFNPQDISIPLMNYDKVAINFDRRNGGASFEITTIVIDKNYSGNSIAVNDITSADSIMYHTTRTFTPNWNTSKISFANGKQNGSVVDDVMIPLEIYGVK